MEAREVLDSDRAGRRAIRGGALRVAGYVAGLLLGLISVPLLIRHLGVADFGRYVTVQSVFAIAVGLTEGGLVSVAVREYSTRTGLDRDRTMRNLFGMRLVLSTVAVIAAFLFAVVAGYDQPLVLGILIAAPGVVAQAIQAFMSVSIQSELRFGALTLQDLVTHAATVAAIVTLVLLNAELLPFIAIPLPVGLLGLAVTTYLTQGRMPRRPAFDRTAWRTLLRDSVPYAAAVAVGAIYFRVTIVIMSLVATELETGYFATSYRVVEVLILVPLVLITAVFPIMARAASTDTERFRYAISRALEVAFIAGAWMALSLALGADFVIQVIAGDEGKPAVDVLQVQALALVATFVAQTCSFGLLSLHRYRGMLIGSSLALATNALLTGLLAPDHGAHGAAIATVATEGALAVVLLIALARAEHGVGLPWGTALRVIPAAGVAVLAGLLPVHSVIVVAVATLAYFGVLAAVGGIPRDLVAALSRGG
jgi:O-antigen/teichoic acid export membrane protein